MDAMDLKTYPIPNRIKAELNNADRLAALLARNTKPVPDTIVVPEADYRAVDAIVRALGGPSIHQVRWSGRLLACA